MKFCSKCGKEIDEKAVICVNCGCAIKVKKPLYKKWWFWVIIAVLVIGLIGSSSSGDSTSSNIDNSNISSQTTTTSTVPVEFVGECPIIVSANVSENILGYPEVNCHIENNTDKEIAAIKFYFVPKDVYGEEVNTILTTNQLYTDTPISANASKTSSWQMLDQDIKSGDLYIYSVYFSDSTEWGDKDASLSKIKKYAVKITVEG